MHTARAGCMFSSRGLRLAATSSSKGVAWGAESGGRNAGVRCGEVCVPRVDPRDESGFTRHSASSRLACRWQREPVGLALRHDASGVVSPRLETLWFTQSCGPANTPACITG